MESLKIIKIGGNIVDNPAALDKFLGEFAALEGAKILIHGGGKIATKISAALDIETTMIEGRRVTDRETLGVVTMVYCGLINKKIVAKSFSLGAKAWGVCGADANLIPATKRIAGDVDYGFVGDVVVEHINTEAFESILKLGYNPIVAPITMDADGQLLNTNADTIAQSIAVAMSKKYEVELIYIFEKAGVLMDIEDQDSLIETITKQSYQTLKSKGIVTDGMLPKLDNAYLAIEAGVREVVICNSLATTNGKLGGTTISQ